MPGPFNPRDWDVDPWPLDAGLIPFSMRIPERKINPTVDEYFRQMAKDNGEFDLPPPWPHHENSPGRVPYNKESDHDHEGKDDEGKKDKKDDMPGGLGDNRLQNHQNHPSSKPPEKKEKPAEETTPA